MSWKLCTSGAAIAKAGANVNPDIITSGVAMAQYSDEVEGTINMKTRKDWIAGIGSVSANTSGALSDLASTGIAMKIVNYDHSGYVKGESSIILNVLKDEYDNIIKDLREKNYQEKM